MENFIGNRIAQKRKELGYTQQNLADKLNISFQAVSKWENGSSTPDVHLLPELAGILQTSVDSLLGYHAPVLTKYEDKYKQDGYYWGITPNRLCYEIMKLMPPTKPYRILDIGCGEGKDAVFLAKNGYQVSAFDLADSGLKKARELADRNHVDVDFFRANINEFILKDTYDIIFSSGVFHYLEQEKRKDFVEMLKKHTAENGLNVVNVFVEKPFIQMAPDMEENEKKIKKPWYTGELDSYYHDWLFHERSELIFDCNSGGVPHKHCMDVVIAQKRG